MLAQDASSISDSIALSQKSRVDTKRQQNRTVQPQGESKICHVLERQAASPAGGV